MIKIILISIKGMVVFGFELRLLATVFNLENVQGRRCRSIWEDDVKIGILELRSLLDPAV